jgi:hypothetical protein
LATRPYPEKYRHLFAKGDAISFADVGITSLTVSPGFAEGQEERIIRYVHKPADRADEDFDKDYLLKFCLAYRDLARAIADAQTVPKGGAASPVLSSRSRIAGCSSGCNGAQPPWAGGGLSFHPEQIRFVGKTGQHGW